MNKNLLAYKLESRVSDIQTLVAIRELKLNCSHLLAPIVKHWVISSLDVDTSKAHLSV